MDIRFTCHKKERERERGRGREGRRMERDTHREREREGERERKIGRKTASHSLGRRIKNTKSGHVKPSQHYPTTNTYESS